MSGARPTIRYGLPYGTLQNGIKASLAAFGLLCVVMLPILLLGLLQGLVGF